MDKETFEKFAKETWEEFKNIPTAEELLKIIEKPSSE